MRRRVKFQNIESDVEVANTLESLLHTAKINVETSGDFVDGISDYDKLVEDEVERLSKEAEQWIYGYLIYIGQESYQDPDTQLPMLTIVGVLELDDGTVTHIPTEQLKFVYEKR